MNSGLTQANIKLIEGLRNNEANVRHNLAECAKFWQAEARTEESNLSELMSQVQWDGFFFPTLV